MIFDYVGRALGAGRVAGFIFFPDHGAEQVVAADFDVGWIVLRGAAAKHNVFAGGFEKIVVDLEGSEGLVAVSAAEGGGVCAGSFARDAIEAADVGVDDGDVVASKDHADAVADFGALAGVHVIAIEDDVVIMVGVDHAAGVVVWGSGPLDADEADVISDDDAVVRLHHNYGEEFGCASGGLGKCGSAGKTGYAGPCGRNARAFRGQLGVRDIAANCDVVLVIALLLGQVANLVHCAGGEQ